MVARNEQEVLARLTAKFPGSARVRRLTAMKLEAEGEFEEAISIYNSLLIDDPADTVPTPFSLPYVCVLCVVRRVRQVLEGEGGSSSLHPLCWPGYYEASRVHMEGTKGDPTASHRGAERLPQDFHGRHDRVAGAGRPLPRRTAVRAAALISAHSSDAKKYDVRSMARRYEFAAFCYEELILAEPLNHHYINRYAEVPLTLCQFKATQLSARRA
jgi:hypothetical protein